jgi:tetratricopeptide (TPR) repeat protein
MAQHALDELVDAQIRELCARGDALAAERQFEKAFDCYRGALNLVPEPAEDWEATTWILAAIGDLHFLQGKFEKSVAAFDDAVRCPGGLGNPFIHLRLGQGCFELDQQDRAADELTRAYMGAGRRVFDTENPKYVQFLETRLKLPIDQGN